MKFHVVVLLMAACAAPLVASAQGGGSAPKTSSPSSGLHLTARTSVPFTGAVVGKARCDGDGNLYVRFMDAATSRTPHATATLPIRRIKPDGTAAGAFSISDASPELSAVDFFVTDDGRVYVEAWVPSDGRVYVAEFSSDGTLKSKTKLDSEPFTPRQIVVFKSGEFLLSGTQGTSDQTPYTGVFSATGKLIKKVYEAEDDYSRRRAEAGDQDFVSSRTQTGNTSVWHGDAVVGSDGNVYLLRATSPALIYVISPTGEIVRKLRIDSPTPGLVGQTVRAAPGKLAVSFQGDYSTVGVTKVVDLQGNPIATYSADDKRIYPGLPGCYTSGHFTSFDTDDQGNIYLHRADPN